MVSNGSTNKGLQSTKRIVLKKSRHLDVMMFAISCVIMMFATSLSTATYNDARDLYDTLTQNYSKYIRPVNNQSNTLTVSIHGFYVHNINSFDELSGKLSLSGAFSISWKDEILRWNPASFSGINSILISNSRVWVPKLFLANGVEKSSIYNPSDDSNDVLYYANGTTTFQPSVILETFCQADMLYYPYDFHTCKLEVSTYTTTNKVNLTTTAPGMYLVSYNANLIWKVESTSVEILTLKYNSIVNFYITITRRPIFMILTLVLPVVAMTFMNLLVFLIPSDSGEKVSYSITVLLTFAVYLSLYSDKVPPTGLSVSVLSVSMVFKLSSSCIITMCTIVISRINSYSDTKCVPRRLQKLVCLLRKNKVDSTTIKNPREEMEGVPEQTDVTTPCNISSKSKNLRVNEMATATETNINWKEVSKALDILCLIIFTAVSTIEAIVTIILITNRK